MNMLRQNILPLISACSVGIGAYLGAKYERLKPRPSEQHCSNTPWTLEAASLPFTENKIPEEVTLNSSVSEIMKYGYPSFGMLKVYNDFVLAYDKRNRNAYWVFEHLAPYKLPSARTTNVDRSKSSFFEDKQIHEYFRSFLIDYKNSGYDRGHLAAAGNHRHSQEAMDQTFIMSNISPQVGEGFNRGIWNDLEKYVRSVGRNNRNTYVCTGPLYLPRKEPNGKVYVKYEVIGPNQVAVPTHFFKVLLIETNNGEMDLMSFVIPNEPIKDNTPLSSFHTPINAIERASGFLLFEKFQRKRLRYINGKKP